MLDELRAHYHAAYRRVRRFERREIREFQRWVEHTGNLLHLSVLVVVPLLIALVTWLSNSLRELSFLLFPPLAAGTYTLFADPHGRYASPWRFVGGLTVGALAGWVALEIATRFLAGPTGGPPNVSVGGAALGVFLTAVATWALDLEEPAAFSTALLVLVTGTHPFAYVISVAVSSSVVAAGFVLWREGIYERRARLLYRSTRGDDHVLVPMSGTHAETAAVFAARLAAAHEAGKVVLLDVVGTDELRDVERDVRADHEEAASPGTPIETEGNDSAVEIEAEARVADAATDRLAEQERRIERLVGVPCEFVVVAGESGDPAVVLEAAREANCDLIVTPYEERGGGLSPFVRGLFRSDLDVIAFRTDGERTRWTNVLVPVRKPGDTAHKMVDFARRLAGDIGSVSVCTCIPREAMRRSAERTLANLVETFPGHVETRVARSSLRAFLDRNAASYDLVVIGASTDRSTASRFISPPTFERIRDIETDMAIVHRG
jgi:nucleotide-binding universal stress UspA family protein